MLPLKTSTVALNELQQFDFLEFSLSLLYIYIYIYIYMCVCVCVCVFAVFISVHGTQY